MTDDIRANALTDQDLPDAALLWAARYVGDMCDNDPALGEDDIRDASRAALKGTTDGNI